MKRIVKYISTLIGLFLLVWCVIFFVLGFIFKSVVDILTWFEVRLGRMMKRCMGEEL